MRVLAERDRLAANRYAAMTRLQGLVNELPNILHALNDVLRPENDADILKFVFD